MHVRDLMTTDVVAVAPTTSVRDAARMMFRYRVSGLPVVDSEDHVLGIITEGDFLALEVARAEAGIVPELVRDVMSHSVLSVPAIFEFNAFRFFKAFRMMFF